MIYNNNDIICRICGGAVQIGKKICACCEETFALCDIDDYINCETDERNTENSAQTLLNSSNLW